MRRRRSCRSRGEVLWGVIEKRMDCQVFWATFRRSRCLWRDGASSRTSYLFEIMERILLLGKTPRKEWKLWWSTFNLCVISWLNLDGGGACLGAIGFVDSRGWDGVGSCFVVQRAFGWLSRGRPETGIHFSDYGWELKWSEGSTRMVFIESTALRWSHAGACNSKRGLSPQCLWWVGRR